MRRTTPQILNFTSHLIAHATRGEKAAKRNRVVAFRVCEKLRPRLAALVGESGFRTLLMRALVLAQPHAPSLRAVVLEPDGSFKYSGERHMRLAPKELAEGGVILVAELLSLLIAFIGEDMTIRMVRDVWPQLPQRDFDLPKGQRHEA
jgi:hypothetical protein